MYMWSSFGLKTKLKFMPTFPNHSFNPTNPYLIFPPQETRNRLCFTLMMDSIKDYNMKNQHTLNQLVLGVFCKLDYIINELPHMVNGGEKL